MKSNFIVQVSSFDDNQSKKMPQWNTSPQWSFMLSLHGHLDLTLRNVWLVIMPGLGREAQNVADASSKFTAQAVNEQ